jgi:hypothetical protein
MRCGSRADLIETLFEPAAYFAVAIGLIVCPLLLLLQLAQQPAGGVADEDLLPHN